MYRHFHNMSHSRLYCCWVDMKQRCLNPKNTFYPRYGGRGIKICEAWMDFVPFMNWSLSNGYNDTLTIDRINNDGNYEPSNCKWSTQKEQAQNKTHKPNSLGHVGIRRVYRSKGKICGYKATAWADGKEIYLGFSTTLEGAIAIREKYDVSNCGRHKEPER